MELTVTSVIAETVLPPASAPSNERRRLLSICAILLSIAYFRCINPAEFYLHEYLETSKRLSALNIVHQVWPFSTYAQLIVLIPVAIGGGRLVPFPTLIFTGLSLRLVSSVILLLSPSAINWPYQAGMAILGSGIACKVAFLSFSYTVLPLQLFVRMSSYKRGVNLLGYVSGGVIAFGLKRTGTDWSIFFLTHQAALALTLLIMTNSYILILRRSRIKFDVPAVESGSDLMALGRIALRNPSILAASAWYILTLATFEVVNTNTSTVLFAIDPVADGNGVVLALARIVSALVTIAFGARLHTNPNVAAVLIATALSAAVTAGLGQCGSATLAYASVIGLTVILEPCFCAIMNVIADGVPSSLRRAAIFVNIMAALSVQAVLSLACRIAWVSIPTLFLVLGVTQLTSAVILVFYLINNRQQCRDQQ